MRGHILERSPPIIEASPNARRTFIEIGAIAEPKRQGANDQEQDDPEAAFFVEAVLAFNFVFAKGALVPFFFFRAI